MSEEDIELRDLVAQTLEQNGLLSKIRAEIRASVFLAIEENENFKENDQFMNKRLKAFVGTNEGSLVTCLVREFLEFFELDFTLSVFDPETCEGRNYNYGGKSKLISDLNLDGINGKKEPLLLEILRLAVAKNNHHLDKKENLRNEEVQTEKAQPEEELLCANKSNLLIDLNSAFGKDLEEADAKENSSSHIQEAILSRKSQETQQKAITVNTVGKTKQVKDNVLSTNFIDELSPRSLLSSDSDSSHHNSKNGHEMIKNPENSASALSNRNAFKNHNKADTQLPPSSAGLSSLSNLPPLFGMGSAPEPLSTASLPSLNQVKDIYKIKAMMDMGLDSQDNYDEDFNSATGSAKEGASNHGTDSEIEEELGFGEDDLLSSASGMEDMTAELSIGTTTGAADYLEDVK